MTIRAAITLLLALSVPLLSGCAATGLLWKSDDTELSWADRDNPALRCLCVWQPAEGTWEGKPTRGFGGQIFFLPRSGHNPVAVHGDVRIYVFDDQGTAEEQAKPLHKFDFIKGAWQQYLGQTQFGPAYNIFIPYTRPGQHQAECVLRVRLVSDDGPTVHSDMARVMLKGFKPSTEPETATSTGSEDLDDPSPSVALSEAFEASWRRARLGTRAGTANSSIRPGLQRDNKNPSPAGEVKPSITEPQAETGDTDVKRFSGHARLKPVPRPATSAADTSRRFRLASATDTDDTASKVEADPSVEPADLPQAHPLSATARSTPLEHPLRSR